MRDDDDHCLRTLVLSCLEHDTNYAGSSANLYYSPCLDFGADSTFRRRTLVHADSGIEACHCGHFGHRRCQSSQWPDL